MRDLPPLAWLRAFEVAARHLSFTSAAQELALSQAAVSKQIKLLEHQLGEPLFLRFPRSLALTKAGAAFLPKVEDAFERLGAGYSEVFGAKRNDVLTIRCAAGLAVNWLAPRLPEFIAHYPDVSLRLISSIWNEDDNNAAYDLDIRYGEGGWPGLNSHRLTQETLQPLCSPEVMASGQLQQPSDLKNHNLIHVLGYKEGWAIWLKKANAALAVTQTGIQCDTSLMAFALAAAGSGIALGRTSMAEAELREGRLVAPFDLAVPVKEGFYLIAPKLLGKNHSASLFKQWLLTTAKIEPHS